MKHASGPKRIRQLLAQPGIIRSLGAHDVFTALIVEQAGFETAFAGGFGTSGVLAGPATPRFSKTGVRADAAGAKGRGGLNAGVADGRPGGGALDDGERP